ncbi:hypothetical protein F511_25906 [Dorcoceras hygrometricum]|uniref:Uncharacterized protein n=1 Tax=Dorcoceras hygrometricum TaxID=472368 RepID=A0A2Z7A3E3_9LAMI|nr:hypothetical protein F511_25906 [Dorcoceras hygrometricum]
MFLRILEPPDFALTPIVMIKRLSLAYIALVLLSYTADLSIGGASPDTSPTPFDKCSLVVGIRTCSPISDVRRPRGPRRSSSSSAELFGYISID